MHLLQHLSQQVLRTRAACFPQNKMLLSTPVLQTLGILPIELLGQRIGRRSRIVHLLPSINSSHSCLTATTTVPQQAPTSSTSLESDSTGPVALCGSKHWLELTAPIQ